MTDVANVTLRKASLPSTAWLMVRALVTLSLLVMKERWVRHFSSFLESTWLVLGTNTVKDQLKLDPFVLHLRRGKKGNLTHLQQLTGHVEMGRSDDITGLQVVHDRP